MKSLGQRGFFKKGKRLFSKADYGNVKDDSIKQLDKRVLNINSTNRQINIENFIINHP